MIIVVIANVIHGPRKEEKRLVKKQNEEAEVEKDESFKKKSKSRESSQDRSKNKSYLITVAI